MTSAPGPAAQLRFLVVEDHDYQRGVLTQMLRRLGAAHVVPAADGEQALTLVKASPEPFDIVLTDLDMPGMDGMALIGQLAACGANPALIVASAYGRPLLGAVHTMVMAYGLRVLGTLSKPVSQADLATAIARYRTTLAGTAIPTAPARTFDVEEIRNGIRQGEFEPYYQPKVDLATLRVRGAEALARWRHPHHGLIGPQAFVGPLERSGFIDALTWAMVDAAAAACAAWRRGGLDAGVAVNLSPASLGDDSLAERLITLTRHHGLEPSHLTFEITESAALARVGPALENLTRLRLRGFGLSIDDYGTGYSSLQMLSRIAFTELKIDGSFIAGAGGTDAGRVILESTVAMARRLGITSVAECVETREQAELMGALGCELAQGYLLGAPMELAAFLRWCEKPVLPRAEAPGAR